MASTITVIGAGLAGSEAAMQLAENGCEVVLYEMRPRRMTEAHTGPGFAELVCSNSFGSDSPGAASRILKDELQRLGGFVLASARAAAVPAGASLAVDRIKFSEHVTAAISAHPRIKIVRDEAPSLPDDGLVIVATGPLTSPRLADSLASLLGDKGLYFYDAISPIVSADSLNMDVLYLRNRYDKGDSADFLNVPLTREQYETLVADLLSGDVMLPHDFEEEKYFEGCMPIEAIAARGPRTLAFGPLKPVGLEDPTGKRPHAVIQLRAENRHRTSYNLVGFQTKLKYGEQERIFRKLPGLENAEFLRLGSMHRNTYLNSPKHLLPTLQLKACPRVLIAGQLTGTEGYLESTATGLIAGRTALALARGETPAIPPEETMLGALLRAITDETRKHFQPMNSNIGVLPPLPERPRDKKLRNALHAERSSASLSHWMGAQSFKSLRMAEGTL